MFLEKESDEDMVVDGTSFNIHRRVGNESVNAYLTSLNEFFHFNSI